MAFAAMRHWRWIGPAAVLAAAGLLAAFLLRAPGLPIDAANGSYAHDCCGTLTLDDGLMSFGESRKTVRYSVGRDEAGPYILPATYVGPWEERGFEIDGSRPPLKLRLDTLPRPAAIALGDGRKSYLLTRKRFTLPRRP